MPAGSLSRAPITTTGVISADALSGTLAGGGGELILNNTNGDITIGSAGR